MVYNKITPEDVPEDYHRYPPGGDKILDDIISVIKEFVDFNPRENKYFYKREGKNLELLITNLELDEDIKFEIENKLQHEMRINLTDIDFTGEDQNLLVVIIPKIATRQHQESAPLQEAVEDIYLIKAEQYLSERKEAGEGFSLNELKNYLEDEIKKDVNADPNKLIDWFLQDIKYKEGIVNDAVRSSDMTIDQFNINDALAEGYYSSIFADMEEKLTMLYDTYAGYQEPDNFGGGL